MPFAAGREGWPEPDLSHDGWWAEVAAVGTLYPTGYGTRRVTLAQLRAEHHPDKMHPEYARRLFAWLESMGGRVGIGGSFRYTQPTSGCPLCVPEGKSFHQYQDWPSGRYFAAVDLVQASPTPGAQHISMSWNVSIPQGSADARKWGLHANVGAPPSGEPWHLQGIEYDGWQSWVNAGRPDLTPNYPLPTSEIPVTPEELRAIIREEIEATVGPAVWSHELGPKDKKQRAGVRLVQTDTKTDRIADAVGQIVDGGTVSFT